MDGKTISRLRDMGFREALDGETVGGTEKIFILSGTLKVEGLLPGGNVRAYDSSQITSTGQQGGEVR